MTEPALLDFTLADRGTLTLPLDDVPDMVVALLKHRRATEARSLLARWFVAHAQATGNEGWELGP